MTATLFHVGDHVSLAGNVISREAAERMVQCFRANSKTKRLYIEDDRVMAEMERPDGNYKTNLRR